MSMQKSFDTLFVNPRTMESRSTPQRCYYYFLYNTKENIVADSMSILDVNTILRRYL